MIGIEYVIAFGMAVTNVIKKRVPENQSDLVPFISFAICVGLNVVNALVFNGSVSDAAKDAFVSAGVALTLFTTGSAVGRIAQKKPPDVENNT